MRMLSDVDAWVDGCVSVGVYVALNYSWRSARAREQESRRSNAWDRSVINNERPRRTQGTQTIHELEASMHAFIGRLYIKMFEAYFIAFVVDTQGRTDW